MRIRDEQVRLLVEIASQQHGWEVYRIRSNHIVFVAPCGAKVTSASTPSDWRGTLNLRARLRRLGLAVPARRG